MIFFRSSKHRQRRRAARRVASRAEQLERRLALTVSAESDQQAFNQALDLGHPQTATCGCAGCAMPPPEAIELSQLQLPVVAEFPLEDTFRLHSRPTASKRIYLDFDGHTATGTAWGGTIVTPAFSLDSNYNSFSDSELTLIQEIWARVVEDFSPFDVDVTTEQPSDADLINSGGGDTRWGVRVVVGGNGSWLPGAAGVAFLNGFGRTDLAPAFAFADQSWKTNANFAAVVISHEVGHTLGLNHHGYLGSEYYGGRGNWGPLMGNPSRLLTQWSNGDYGGATRPQQDDLAIITSRAGNGFGYRPDDHGNTLASATPYAGADITGVIERNTDTDLFRFVTGSRITAQIRPASVGANLDILAEILDSAGTVIATSNPQNALTANFDITVGAGTYFLRVQGTGQGDPATTGYSNYGSLGQYTVSLTVDASPEIVSVEDRVGTIQGSVPNGGRTNDPSPVVRGSGAAGATITLQAGSLTVGSGTVETDGNWAITVSPPLNDGVYELFVEDSFGGSSNVAFVITVDTAAPPAPVLLSVFDDVGLIQGPLANRSRTDDTELRLAGSATPGSSVTAYSNGTALGSTTVGGNGSWSLTTPPLDPGRHELTITSSDDVGNESGFSAPPFEVTIDTDLPGTPLITGILDSAQPDTGAVPQGGFTNDVSPRITGTGQPGSLVRVSSRGLMIGQATVTDTGTWQLVPPIPLADGQYTLIAVASNDIGGESAPSAPFVFSVDTVPPTVTITRSGNGPLALGQTTTVTFSVSELSTRFSAAAVTTTGGSLVGFSRSGATSTATFVPAANFEGTALITIPNNAFTDAAGYANLGTSLTIPVDTVAPTITMNIAEPGILKVGQTAVVSFVLREPAVSFGLSAIVTTGGRLTGLQGSGTAYTATFVPTAAFRGTATLAVPAGRFTDAAGNGNVAALPLSVLVDTVAPTIIGFRATPATARLDIGESVAVEADFSEAVTSGRQFIVRFDTGGEASLVVDPSGLVARGRYTARAGEQSSDLDIVAIVPDDAIRNASGNRLAEDLPPVAARLATRHTIAVDATVKLVDAGAFSTDASLVRDVKGQYRRIPVRFNTPVTGVTRASLRVAIDGQPLPLRNAQLRGSGANYTLLIPPSRRNPVGIYTLTLDPHAIRAVDNGSAANEAVALHWGFRTSVGMVPDPPAGVSPDRVVLAGRRTSVEVSWMPGAANGGGPVTQYLVQYRLAGTNRWIAVREQIPGWRTKATIRGVLPNQTYEFRVAARNAAGVGLFATSSPFQAAWLHVAAIPNPRSR